jgi:hypothetical protein
MDVVVVLPWVPAMATQLFSQHFGAAHHRQPARPRRREFRVIGLDRRGDDHDAGVAQIGGVMADRDRNALVA